MLAVARLGCLDLVASPGDCLITNCCCAHCWLCAALIPRSIEPAGVRDELGRQNLGNHLWSLRTRDAVTPMSGLFVPFTYVYPRRLSAAAGAVSS